MEFEDRIGSLDLTLFERIPSQSTRGDRISWLALQRAVRNAKGSFTYLEIGSYLGGSLQPYLMDPRCRRIYSDLISGRARFLTIRGSVYSYAGSTTERMLNNLRAIDNGQIGKVTCFKPRRAHCGPGLHRSPDPCRSTAIPRPLVPR